MMCLARRGGRGEENAIDDDLIVNKYLKIKL